VGRALLIVNPAARGGRSAEVEALTAFGEIGVAVDVRRTTRAGDAALFASQHQGSEPVYTLGGDGTVMEAVGALIGRDVPVGILPGGTGNQLARHFRIPLSVRRAVRALRGARVVPLDLGRLVDGPHFALTAGLGLDAALIAGATPASKRRFGVLAYVWSGANAVRVQKPFNVRVEADGQVFEREASLAMIANVGALLDGHFALGPGVTPDDGLLDLAIFSPRGALDGAHHAWRMVRRDFRADARMLFLRASHISVSAPDGVLAQADGELLKHSRIDATVVPGGARFLAPAE
jgi:YegS/Rv2252/BmrU family lipid kinase